MSADVSNTVALAVDLDGTLVRSDLFLESLLTLIRRNPLSIFSILAWVFSGRAVLKRRVSERVQLDPRLLPYQEEVLQFVRAERAAGRHTVLATGSDQLLVQPVADYLDCFDAVMASDGDQNRTGRSKERQLTDTYGESGFDYIGNSTVDLPVWRGARCALLAARGNRLARKLGERLDLERVFYYPAPGWSQWAQLLHVRHWAWNLLVFAPLLLVAPDRGNSAWIAAGGAFLSLNLGSSGVLLGVDLLNVSLDRQHPLRHSGPLPAGQVNLFGALFLSPLLLVASLLLVQPLAAGLGLVVALYSLALLISAPYDSTSLPALVLLCVLRVITGGVAAGIPAVTRLAALPL